MAAVTADIASRVADWSDAAFAAFCEDVGDMFGVDMQCTRREAHVTAVHNLREHFKKLSVVHLTKAEGVLDGMFHLVFDQGGLFILSGVVVMLPENRILEDVKRGTLENAENLQDAAREVGNLLVGSWDRIFREQCRGHEHFVKTSTFVGKPWDKPEQVELQADTQIVLVLYEMSIEPYPAFTCAAAFPLAVLKGLGEAGPETETIAEKEPEPAKATPARPEASGSPAPQADAPPGSDAQTPAPPDKTDSVPPQGREPAGEPRPAAVGATQASSMPVLDASPAPVPPAEADARTGKIIPPGRRDPAIDAGTGTPNAKGSPTGDSSPVGAQYGVGDPMLPSELASAESGGAAGGSGYAFLDEAYIQSPPRGGLPSANRHAWEPGPNPPDWTGVTGEESDCSLLLSRPVGEIMEKEVVWAGPEDTVQDVIAKMQQHNVGYVLVGSNGVLEGLVSNSNILGAVSLYLRPMFAKWRRAQDDATLGVKVKWIMSRPVRTVRPDATLAAVIESMRRCGGRCLPVVDAKGTVQGMVTALDILLRILESDRNTSWKGRPPQAPALMI